MLWITSESCKFGIKIDTSLQIGTARLGCVCYGLRIDDGCGVEVTHKYLGMYGIGVLDNFFGIGFFGEEA